MILLATFLLPAVFVPIVYLVGRESVRRSAYAGLLASVIDLFLLLTTLPKVLSVGKYSESYHWIPMLGSPLTLFVDGMSLSMTITTMMLIISSFLFSIDYMEERKSLREYYALLALLTVGLVGVFITSNLMVFYFCWEF
ncbi:MAG: hypothetical protein OEZ24_00265, partial [Candidatus Bathyarchaeota archaeon]|nr:hypothetical protein [Candidatus Bathyarchaeota archaeon]